MIQYLSCEENTCQIEKWFWTKIGQFGSCCAVWRTGRSGCGVHSEALGQRGQGVQRLLCKHPHSSRILIPIPRQIQVSTVRHMVRANLSQAIGYVAKMNVSIGGSSHMGTRHEQCYWGWHWLFGSIDIDDWHWIGDFWIIDLTTGQCHWWMNVVVFKLFTFSFD